jgi:hypothetical protein
MHRRDPKNSANSEDTSLERLIVSRELGIPAMTAEDRDIQSWANGDVMLNTTTDQLNYYASGTWHIVDSTGDTSDWLIGGNTLSGAGTIGTLSPHTFSIVTNGQTRMSWTSVGNLSMPTMVSGILKSTSGVISSGTIGTADLPTIPYSKLNVAGSIVNGDIVSVEAPKITGQLTYSQLSMAGSIVDADIVSLDYSKLTNAPSGTQSVNMADGSTAKIAVGTLRFTRTGGSVAKSVIQGKGLSLNATEFVGAIWARLDIAGLGTSAFIASATCGRLPFTGVYIPRVENDIHDVAGNSSIDIRIYAGYDGAALTSLPSDGTYDFHVMVIGI